jgi:lactoylglutathione lyase
MKFGYTILDVADVALSLCFYERAFGFKRRFLHESGTYGELETGETTLSFASHDLSDENVQGGHVRASESKAPLGMEIGLVSLDVASAQSHALREGGIEFSAPVTKPWGQIVSYVRAPDGFLIELCTPAGE